MKLIPDWRQAWRWWSVRVPALGALMCTIAIISPDAASALWHALPADLIASLPQPVQLLVPIAISAMTIVARLLDQRLIDQDKADD
jgi:hypothetical protein